MKKILPFFLFAASLICCTSSDDGVTPHIDFKVDGAAVNMPRVTVLHNTTEAGTALFFEGKSETGGPDKITFYTTAGSTSYAYSEFKYYTGNTYFYPEDDFQLHFQINDGHRLKGTFSGLLVNFNGLTTINVTDGNFDVEYY